MQTIATNVSGTQTWPSSAVQVQKVTMVPGGNTCLQDLYDPKSHLTLKHQNGLGCQPRLQASALLSMATGATDINTEFIWLLQGHGSKHRLWGQSRPNVTMDLFGSACL